MAEPLDPNKYHIIPRTKLRKIIITAVVLAVIFVPLISVRYYQMAINRPSPSRDEQTFEIKNGDGVAEISSGLYRAGALNSEFLFSLYVFLNKLDRNIQAGVYTITAGAPVVDLAEQFQHGVNDTRITFLEGWRTEEYARVAALQFEKIDYSEFVRKAQQYEGYLFPDTYYFELETREDDMIARLRETFNLKTKDMLTQENLDKVGLTKEQTIILASIVEREVNTEADRPLVAGILIKRFKENTLLGADATTQYATAPIYLCGKENYAANICAASLEEINDFNWWRKEITQQDLEYENAFNTRKVEGLPPRPISNPSLLAIRAVVYPEQSDYMYYLTDVQGKTHFAETLEEHNANVSEFLR